MNSRRIFFLFILILVVAANPYAQRILFSDPDKEDSRRINFEIIGKMGNNFLIYKSVRNENFICVYDNSMKQIAKEKHEYLPDERLINIDFFVYPNFVYAIYQYQKRNIVHCSFVKLDGMGKKISDPVELDTTSLGGSTNNKIYTALASEDKQKIILFKINSRNRDRFLITTKLYTDKLELLKRSSLVISMDDNDDHLGEFNLDNEGDLVFSKFYRNNNESISKAYLITKRADADSFSYYKINIDKFYLDELRLKVDNNNQRYLLNAFYYNQKRGNIDGLFVLAYNKNTNQPDFERTFEFSEDLRREAKGEASLKATFNDYFIRNIIIKKDGGFLLDAEAFYTTSRYSPWNRWDYMYGSPYMYPMDYYFYSPYYSNYWWRRNSSNQAVRYHADNLVILSFDKNGQIGWSNIIRKEQYDDESDDKVSYQVMNTGGQLHFLFNMQEKKNLLLNEYTLLPGGEVNKNPTLKNLDQGQEFMPKYGKQVSARQFIVPCIFRNYICFAKIDYN
jgi:hypothetical protein